MISNKCLGMLMNKFFIITNSEKDVDLETTLYIQDYIMKKGGSCQIQRESHAGAGEHYRYTNPAGIAADTDAILVLGGDGTVIQAAHDVADCGIPILGINLGTLGYLAEIDCHNIRQALDSLFAGTYEIEERMMLEGGRSTQLKEQWEIALNDIVISRQGKLRVVEYRIFVNDKYLTSYKADGMIVSTPTGSTGYSMSAGGPIVEPDAQLILVTPICPHTLNRTSIVLNAKDHIAIEVWGVHGGTLPEAVASFDAGHGMEMCPGDRLEICRCGRTMKLIKISRDSFLQVLSRKMGN